MAGEKRAQDLVNVPLRIAFQFIASAQAKGSYPYHLTNVKAFLYYNQDNSLKRQKAAGTYSPNLTDNDTFVFWNTIIGLGDTAGNSDQTLLVVEILGNPTSYVRRQLHFEALAGGKVILDKLTSFAILDDNDKYYAAFMLHNTGCEKIKLIATVNGKTEESRLEKTILFECGE